MFIKKIFKYNLTIRYFSNKKITPEILDELNKKSEGKSTIDDLSNDPKFENYLNEKVYLATSKKAFMENYKSQMFDSREQSDKRKMEEYENKYEEDFENYFYNNKSYEERIKKSKIIIDSFRNNSYFYPDDSKNDVKAGYDRFDLYNENYLSRKSKNLYNSEYKTLNDSDFYGKTILNFIKNIDKNIIITELPQTEEQIKYENENSDSWLDENIKHNEPMPSLFNDNNNDTEFEERDFEAFSNAQAIELMAYDATSGEHELSILDNPADINESDSHDDQGRLSPFARLNIYKMYLEGKTVREISLCFGILPARAKAVLWQQQYYFEECLPHLDPETIRLGIEREMISNIFTKFQDYGLDLDTYELVTEGYITGRWDSKVLEESPVKDSNITNNAKKYIDKKKFKKFEVVTKGYIGNKCNGYYIREIESYRGKYNLKLNRMFKKIVERGHVKGALSQRVINKLHLGPRMASSGYNK